MDDKLYTQSDDFKEKSESVLNSHMFHLKRELRFIFGSAIVDNLSGAHLELLEDAMYKHGRAVAREVETFYIYESSKEARQSCANTLQAALNMATLVGDTEEVEE